MATIKSYTDIEQSKKLAEILPIESADMHYEYDYNLGEYINIPSVTEEEDHFVLFLDDVPCWSLAALLNVLPPKYYPVKDHETNLILGIPKDKWCVLYWDTTGMQDGEDTLGDNPIDACYEMILKLHELEHKEHVKKIKNVPLCTQTDSTTFVLKNQII